MRALFGCTGVDVRDLVPRAVTRPRRGSLARAGADPYGGGVGLSEGLVRIDLVELEGLAGAFPLDRPEIGAADDHELDLALAAQVTFR